MSSRTVFFVIHPDRPEAHKFATLVAEKLSTKGFEIKTSSTLEIANVSRVSSDEVPATLSHSEVVLVLGGDGTILRGAEFVHGTNIPVLGINLGHVGFLAQIGKPSPQEVADAIIASDYRIERRMTLAYHVLRNDMEVARGWALNEIAVERNTEQMIELFVQIDHRPLSRWGCDGVICATPTGSTAYAFSAGGPVVWPDVEALVLLPLAAHALFSDPMVVSPNSEIAIDVESETGVLSADGLRKFQLKEGDRIVLTSEKSFIHLAHIESAPFTDRLVAKFKLPIDGWRGE